MSISRACSFEQHGIASNVVLLDDNSTDGWTARVFAEMPPCRRTYDWSNVRYAGEIRGCVRFVETVSESGA